jgi:hypothetical protein
MKLKVCSLFTENPMKQQTPFSACLLTFALLGGGAVQAATMTRADHSAAEERIEATYKTERSACDALKSNAKDVCVQQAKAKEKVAKADLQARYSGKPSDQDKLRKVKADTAYDVAKEMCDDKAGNAKDVCIKEAKAVQVKSLADTKMNESVREAVTDDVKAKMDADYKVAVEKCDALAGDAKSACVTQAKTQYGKN